MLMRSSGNESHEAWKAYQETKLHRSLHVLRRAAMSFKDCSLADPADLLIGDETSLRIWAKEADPQDGPWTIFLRHKADTQDDKAPTIQDMAFTTEGNEKGLIMS